MGAVSHQDMLTQADLELALGKRPFRFFERVGSTMDAAREWIAAEPNLPSGALVIADEQLAGRGRLNRTWHTPPGQALALSVILRPHLAPEQLQRITMLAGIAVAETLSELLVPDVIKLKWPNDVHLAGRKVAGILTEALWLGDQLQAVIVGIGINVRVNFMGTPLMDGAVSLEAFTSTPVNRASLTANILNQIDWWSGRVHEYALVEKWRGLLNTLGQSVQIQTSRGLISGVVDDVDASGALLICDENGQTHRVLVGDIQPL
jgi:BirA family transcriptional regulator, biotin operon repressor / biotin---[acetyl-CoA-carboxylase] ligase